MTFVYKTNSLLAATLLSSRSSDDHDNLSLPSWPDCEDLNTLSTISALYLYTNPPPMGYGSPAPKVAESVLRAFDYNLNPPNLRETIIDGYPVNVPYWLGDNDQFPYEPTHGNFHVGEAHSMFVNFLKQHFQSIQGCTISTINHLLNTNSSILTKGRQTWCPFMQQSLPSSQAYLNMLEFYQRNLKRKAYTILEWVAAFFECCSKDRLEHKTITLVERKSWHLDKDTRQKMVRIRQVRKVSWTITEGADECYRLMMNLARSFCSYIKHGERGKLQRRAIASANMIMRAFLYSIEELHLNLSKMVPGSTIGVGGEEKKQRISTIMQTITLNNPGMNVKVQATQDATKWNECLSADLFALFHTTMYSAKIRKMANLPPPTENELCFHQLCLSGHFLLAIKMITLGEGPLCSNQTHFNRPSWSPENLARFNSFTREWFSRCIPLLQQNNTYIRASPGMLMGMHNALSTTIGLTAVMHRIDPLKGQVVTLRSSDDSMTLYITEDGEYLADLVEFERRSLKMLGINLSKSKSMLFRQGYGEYTSWFQDGEFVAQYGVETSTLRPMGKNPMDDLFSVAKGASVSQQRLEMNPFGAYCKLIVGADNCRRLWRISLNPNKRPGISGHVLLVADGGYLPWTSMRCHLEETSLKETFAKTEQEKNYLLRIRHPDNPFSSEPTEEITFSKELGKLTTDMVECPRTVFHYVKRTNRTARRDGSSTVDTEEACSQVADIMEHVDPTTLLRKPTTRQSMAEYCISYLKQLRTSSVLTATQSDLYEKACAILSGTYTPDDDEDPILMDIDDL